MRRWRAVLTVGASVVAGCATAPDAVPAASSDAIATPLTSLPGRPGEGRRIVADRRVGLCLLCHSAPVAEAPFQGDIATNLAGAGSRWSEGQLRLRLVDPARLNPGTLMPAYGRSGGSVRVSDAWRNKPGLQPQQIEDVVAYLKTLR